MEDLRNRGFSTTGGNLYILNIDTMERLDIQFTPPTIQVASTPNIAAIQIVGRNTPRYQHLGGETIMNLTLDFYADDDNGEDAVLKSKWLESLTASDGNEAGAPRVFLIYGKMFRGMKWIVRSVRTVMNNFDETKGYLPRYATVEVEFAKDPDANLTWSDIKKY